jgi:transposase
VGSRGISAVARAAGVSVPTVRKGLAEIAQGIEPSKRARRPGGGCKPLTQTDPGLVAALKELVNPATRADPISPLRWTSKSTRTLADELAEQGHQVGYRSVAKLLKALGYRLQTARKTKEGSQHPDRDAQFRYLSRQAGEYLDAGDPVISVDTRKREDRRIRQRRAGIPAQRLTRTGQRA